MDLSLEAWGRHGRGIGNRGELCRGRCADALFELAAATFRGEPNHANFVAMMKWSGALSPAALTEVSSDVMRASASLRSRRNTRETLHGD